MTAHTYAAPVTLSAADRNGLAFVVAIFVVAAIVQLVDVLSHRIK